MTETATRRLDLTGALAAAVALGDWIPAQDETFDIAETIAGFLGKFRDHVTETRTPEQGDAALIELGVAIAEACGVAVHAPEYACAECGTTEAQTYVVTILDPDDPDGSRTEVCRPCDDKLRTTEGLPALVYSEQATDSYLDHLASMRDWHARITTTDGDDYDVTLAGAGYGDDHMATIHAWSEDGQTGYAFSTEDVRQVFIH